MAGNSNSGRKPIPEGATKLKNGIEHTRVSGKWVRSDKLQKASKEPGQTPEPEKAPEPKPQARPQEPKPEFNQEPEPDQGDVIRQAEIQHNEADLSAELDSMAELIDSPEIESLNLTESETGGASSGMQIAGKHLVLMLDILGSMTAVFAAKKLFKKKLNKSKLKLTADERKDLEEIADECAKSISSMQFADPWTALIVTYLLIVVFKIVADD